MHDIPKSVYGRDAAYMRIIASDNQRAEMREKRISDMLTAAFQGIKAEIQA